MGWRRLRHDDVPEQSALATVNVSVRLETKNVCATKVSWAMTAARNTALKDAAAMVFAPMVCAFASQDFQARRARSAVALQVLKAPSALATEHAVMVRARARMAILAKTAWPINALKVAYMGNASEENACVNVDTEVLIAP